MMPFFVGRAAVFRHLGLFLRPDFAADSQQSSADFEGTHSWFGPRGTYRYGDRGLFVWHSCGDWSWRSTFSVWGRRGRGSAIGPRPWIPEPPAHHPPTINLRQRGVTHEDRRDPDILFCEESGGAMIINCERAQLPEGRSPLAKRTPNKSA